MTAPSDIRIPLIFGRETEAAAGDALLLEGKGADGPGRAWFEPARAGPHRIGCACCGGRSPAALALTRLALARARGESAFFARVVAVVQTDAGRAEIEQSLVADPMASSCFRR